MIFHIKLLILGVEPFYNFVCSKAPVYLKADSNSFERMRETVYFYFLISKAYSLLFLIYCFSSIVYITQWISILKLKLLKLPINQTIVLFYPLNFELVLRSKEIGEIILFKKIKAKWCLNQQNKYKQASIVI